MRLIGNLTRAGLAAGVLLGIAHPAPANAITITGLYTSAVPAAAQAVIAQALAFYNSTFNGTSLAVTIAFGTQAAGGATSNYNAKLVTYDKYLAKLTAARSASGNDAVALASLPAIAPSGYEEVAVTDTLAAAIGIAPLTLAQRAGCGALNAAGCVLFSKNLVEGSNGNPAPDLFGIAEHEIDEVLGTASGLTYNESTIGPDAADLFRFAAPAARSFDKNSAAGAPSTYVCPDATPPAYLSLDGGATSLARYNNCENGGDYGDFAVDTKRVQDAASSSSLPTELSIASPEVTLLDALGYNLTAPLRPIVMSAPGQGGTVGASKRVIDGGVDDGGVPLEALLALDSANVPEPSSLLLLLAPVAAAGMLYRLRRTAIRPSAP